MKGFPVEIYDRGHSDSLSSIKHARNATVIDEALPQMFDATPESPALRLVRRNLRQGEYIHAEPYEKGMYAFGGRFIYTCDSRFREICQYPIPLHDRDMSKE